MIWLYLTLAVYAAVLVAASLISVKPPRTPVFFSPASVGAPQEEIEFNSRGRTLRGWWIESPNSNVCAVLSHGYLMSRSELSPLANWLWQKRISSLVYDFPGHGKSDSALCSFGVREADDVAAAVAFARTRRPQCKVILIGSSMGAAAGALAMAKYPALAESQVLDSSPSRLWVAGLGWWNFVGGPILRVLLAPTLIICWPMVRFNPFRVDVARALRGQRAPVLILHGDADTLVAPSEAERNAKAAGIPVKWLAGCGHSEGRWVLAKEYFEALEAFLEAGGLLPAGNRREPRPMP